MPITFSTNSGSLSRQDDLNDFLEQSLCGYVTTNLKGEITSVNSRIANWIGIEKTDLVGKRFSGLLAMGGRIFYETHLSPLLKLKGSFEEISTELMLSDGQTLPVLMNGYCRSDKNGNLEFIRLTLYRATDRYVYEHNLRKTIDLIQQDLQQEKAMAVLREQFIAVLGHDLRNPLGAIKSGAYLLSRSTLSDRDTKLVDMIKGSALRMHELIENVMDFARVRLGGGLNLDIKFVEMSKTLEHVIAEVQAIFPERQVITFIDPGIVVFCDSHRISQLLSNLVANAMTHGAKDVPVEIHSRVADGHFMLSVVNGGQPIPAHKISGLFEPFTREEDSPSQQGLGLGLYIAYQIASAHNGCLTASSDTVQTSFSFKMPV